MSPQLEDEGETIRMEAAKEQTMCERLGCTHEESLCAFPGCQSVNAIFPGPEGGVVCLKHRGWRPPPVPQPGEPTMDLVRAETTGIGLEWLEGFVVGVFLGLIISLVIAFSVFG